MVEQIQKITKSSMLREFRTFLLRGSVIDLAIGVIAGATFSALVNSLVKDVMMPFVAAIFGKPDFSDLTWTLNKSIIHYGSFLTAVITFLITMTAIFFFIVKPINLMTEHLLPPTQPGEPEQRDCPECMAQVSAQARRCMYCTSPITPLAGAGATAGS